MWSQKNAILKNSKSVKRSFCVSRQQFYHYPQKWISFFVFFLDASFDGLIEMVRGELCRFVFNKYLAQVFRSESLARAFLIFAGGELAPAPVSWNTYRFVERYP
jgi:hypothetical protein